MSGPLRYHEGEFPPIIADWAPLITLIGEAHAAVARYDGALSAIPNSAVLLSPLLTREALLSSRIEGTQVTMDEVLEFEALHQEDTPNDGKSQDIREILNYRKAMREASKMLTELPLCGRVICQAHRILLDSVRGNRATPGIYRREQNWIGPAGCTLESAYYVPASIEQLPSCMYRWEEYINSEQPDKLVQLAITHAEFEAIHPFRDGNGRVGRLLVPLFLHQSKLIQSPVFYISDYLEEHREEYYGRLRSVSSDNDWLGWVVFFLEAVREQAEVNLLKTNKMLTLYNKLKQRIPEITHSQYSISVLDWIFNRPIFYANQFVDESGVPAPTARRLLRVLAANGILVSGSGGSGRKPKVYAHMDLINIVEGSEILRQIHSRSRHHDL